MGNLFAGLKTAKVSERGIYTNPGKYKVRVNKCIMKHVRKGYDAFICEFVIVESNYLEMRKLRTEGANLTPEQLEALEKTLPNKVGTTSSWFQSLADKDVGFGALKGFAAAITGSNPEDPSFIDDVENILSEAVNGTDDEVAAAKAAGRHPEGSLKGCLLPLETYIIKTKKEEDFTIYKFGQIIDETPPAN
jgi:hypothetical protein